MLRRAMIICFLGTILVVTRVSSAQQIDGVLQALRQESTADTVEETQEAVFRIGSSEAIRQNEAVQVALIEAVDLANADYLASIRNRDPTYSEDQGELLLALIRTVIRLDDARSIPVLIRTVHTGRRVQEALARFGQDAVAPILSAWDGRSAEERTGRPSFRWSGFGITDPVGMARVRRAAAETLNLLER